MIFVAFVGRRIWGVFDRVWIVRTDPQCLWLLFFKRKETVERLVVFDNWASSCFEVWQLETVKIEIVVYFVSIAGCIA
jgi:hypothetical protein